MKKNERGVSLLNAILVFIIIAFILLISIIIYAGSTNSVNQAPEYVEVSGNAETRYFYMQIDEGAKIMYDTLLNNMEALKSGDTKIDFPKNDKISSDKFQTAWDAISLDRPELFYIDTYKLSLVTKKTIYFGKESLSYTLEPVDGGKYYISTFTNEEQIDEALAKLNKIVENIKINATGTTYNKVRYIHDLIIDNVAYAIDQNPNNGNLYGALVNNKAVCEGYADAFKYMLDQLEIPCVEVFGDAVAEDGSTESHAWDYIKMDNGKWYGIDVTWDDPIVYGAGGITSKTKYRYFLKGSDSFLKSHREDKDVSGTGQSFTYPELSKEDYSE